MSDEGLLKRIMAGGKVDSKKPDVDLPLAEEETEVPQDVGPCGWVWPKGCKVLDVERGGSHPVVSFQMVYIGEYSEYTPTKFCVVFDGAKSWRMTVEGRNLRPLYDRLGDHCLRRIRPVTRDMLPDDGKPVVTRITVEEVKEKE